MFCNSDGARTVGAATNQAILSGVAVPTYAVAPAKVSRMPIASPSRAIRPCPYAPCQPPTPLPGSSASSETAPGASRPRPDAADPLHPRRELGCCRGLRPVGPGPAALSSPGTDWSRRLPDSQRAEHRPGLPGDGRLRAKHNLMRFSRGRPVTANGAMPAREITSASTAVSCSRSHQPPGQSEVNSITWADSTARPRTGPRQLGRRQIGQCWRSAISALAMIT